MAHKNYAGESLLTGNFRGSYLNVFTSVYRDPKKPENGKIFQATAVFAADDPFLLELRKAAKAAIVGMWGPEKAKWPPFLAAVDLKNYLTLTGKDGWPLRDGASQKGTGYGPGTVTVKFSCNENYPPKVVNQKKDDVLDKSLVQPGMIYRAVVQPVAYQHDQGAGVKFSLQILQIVKDDGVRFGGGDNSKALELLGALEGGEDDPNNYQNDDL